MVEFSGRTSPQLCVFFPLRVLFSPLHPFINDTPRPGKKLSFFTFSFVALRGTLIANPLAVYFLRKESQTSCRA